MNKLINHYICIVAFMIFIFLNFNLVKSDTIDNIPAPPAGGPSMQGNFNVVGENVPDQIYEKYNNVQIITNGNQNSKQAMWWKNKINVTKAFTIKFYAYITASDLKNVADGITFTIQNDNYNAIGTNGESLGAYGNVRNRNYYIKDYIKNAFSYEFDPYNNADYSDNSLEDRLGNKIGGQHTAFTSTNSDGIEELKRINGFRQIHYDAHSLDDWPGIMYPKWHKFIYSWNPSKDLKKATATVNIDNSDIVQSHELDISTILNNNKQHPFAWWGFTGSTGLYTMISAIADTAVSGDPGITKLVLNLSKLSDAEKNNITEKIDKSKQSLKTKNELKKCIYKPNESSSNPDLSNILVSIINPSYFQSTIKNADLGDVLLYKVDIYNYKTADGLGNDWNNVKVTDSDLSKIGMTSLDNENNIDATYDVIPPIDIDSKSSVKPSSVGLRTIISSPNGGKISNIRNNVVTASGSNFYGDNVLGADSNKSSIASVYVNKAQPPIKPRILIKNNLINISNKNSSSQSNNTTLVDVSNYDSIQYSANISNIIMQSRSSNKATYTFSVPSLADNPQILLNNRKINNKISNISTYYQIQDSKDNRKVITIYNIPSILGGNSAEIKANFQLGSKNPSNFSYIPYFTDKENSYYGNEENYNFKNGQIFFDYINNIDYGYKNSYYMQGLTSPAAIFSEKTQKSYIESNKKYVIAKIIDSRREKNSFSVYLSQLSIKKNNKVSEIGSNESPFELKYVNGNNISSLSPNSVPIEIYNRKYSSNEENDSIISNIFWNTNNELKLSNSKNFNLEKNKYNKRNYKAELNWIIKDNGTP
ncbi:lectin-like domain-containing protein [Apilactobacillus xinyiensis]|uniref:lectin-like domain-containing protein n=1 Tax=Apilactobacillus xinyiensis TaxID=2841032 RepID=UPI00200CCE63|nr:hypothetical protein [Apilactobacillus xinyiensis]MCL0318933.1 hypothetical protein [Apilactobacillus xinyiensis]